MFYLLRKDCKELLGNKKRILIVSIVLIIIVISTYCNMTKNEEQLSTKQIEFGIINQDSSAYSELLLGYFKNSESFSSYLNIIEESKETIEQAFRNGELDIYMEIPQGFSENLIYLEHLPVNVVINTSDTTKAILLKNILESYEKYIRAVEINCVTLYDSMVLSGMDNKLINEKNIEISYDLIFTALGKEDFFQYQEISGFPSTSITNYYSTAILSMLLIYFCLYIGFLMMKERKQGTMKRLHAIGMPMSSILLEKILFSSSVIFSFILMAYLIPNLLWSHQFNMNIVIVYGCAIILSTSFAVFISSVFRNIQNYMLAGNFICFLFCILGGGIIPIMYLPTELSQLARFTPNYWLIKVVLDVQKGTGQEYIIKILIGFFFCSVLFYGLSLMVYGREEARLAE